MRLRIFVLAFGLLALAGPSPATPPATLDGLFEAASRGDMAALTHAAQSARDPELRVLLEARLAVARYDAARATNPTVRALAAGGEPDRRRAALAILSMSAYASGNFAEAASTGRSLADAQAAAGNSESAAATERSWRLAALLAGQPDQRIEGAVAQATIPASVDRAGLPRIAISVNGIAQDAVFDTGANFSVLSAETARRMGIVVLGDEARVSNGVDGTVPVRVGIADRIGVAGTTLRNVPFLIIDDSQLTFPIPGGSYEIRAILGLPVMRALGRFRMESAGRFTVLPPAVGIGAAPNLHASGNDLYVEVEIDGRSVPLHLDTGANHTTLSDLYAAAHPGTVAPLATSEAQSRSAGGQRTQRVASWPNVRLKLAGRDFILPRLQVALPGDAPPHRDYGTLGSNALRTFRSYTIDFASMRLDLGEPVPAPASAP